MALLDKFGDLAQARSALLAGNADPFGPEIERIFSATEGQIQGRPTILAGTNNYLGLTFDPECIAAARAAAEQEGTGTTGSRMANGSFSGHRQLERELADFYAKRYGVVFSTGYQANLSMLSSLLGRDDVVLLDADCHASIYDGCNLGAADILRFRHNDPAGLEKRLRRLGGGARNTLIVVEGIYSMLGDRAPLAEIAEIKTRYGAYLAVDEAHSLGVLGATGRGLAQQAGVEAAVDFVIGTFSKSLGAIGGFCVSDHPALDILRYASRPYIFSASPSPSVIASTRTALRLLRERPELRERLWENARRLYTGLLELGFKLGPEVSPVVAAFLDTRGQALAFWQGLIERGVYVNLVLPPATPGDTALVRVSVSAAHTPAQVDAILQAFAEVAASTG